MHTKTPVGFRSAARTVTVAFLAACSWVTLSGQTTPGCQAGPASPATGADVPATYFGPTPSTVQKELVGPLQLLTAGQLDRRAEMQPMHQVAEPVLEQHADDLAVPPETPEQANGRCRQE